MNFQNLNLISLYILIPIVLGIFLWAHKKKQFLLNTFITKSLQSQIIPSMSTTRRFWKKILILLSLVLIIFCLLRPQYGQKTEIVSWKGRDILIAIDTSASMLTEDVLPSRIERAKQEVIGLIGNLTGDKVALIAMAGQSFVYCPLTNDYSAVKIFLDDLGVGTVPQPGTNVASAIDVALNISKKSQSSSKYLVIFTDGESFEGDLDASLNKAKEKGLVVYTVGVGSPEGDPVPLRDKTGTLTGYKKDKNNQVIISQINEFDLKRIAIATKGSYFHSSKNTFISPFLYKELSNLEKQLLEKTVNRKSIDRYQIFLLIVFILLLVETFLTEKKRRFEER